MFSIIRASENIAIFNEILNKANMAETLIYDLIFKEDWYFLKV